MALTKPSFTMISGQESGTFTPVASGGTTTTYYNQIGYYSTDGVTCVLQWYMRVNSLGDGSASAIGGVPFANSSSTLNHAYGTRSYSGIAVSVVQLFAWMAPSVSTVSSLGSTAAASGGSELSTMQDGAYHMGSLTHFR